MTLLEVQNCSLSFGGVKALTDFSASLQEGEFLGIIGPNGAGKTTLFNILTGVYVPNEGRIHLGGESLAGQPSYAINRKGIARTFQNIRLFQNLSVEENVLAGFHHRVRSSFLGFVLRSRTAREEESQTRRRAHELLEIFGLSEKVHDQAKNLPYGDQRRLEIVRAMCTDPVLLCLDEPAAGLNPRETDELNTLLLSIRDAGCSLLLIEHDMGVVMRISDHVIVLDHGKKISDGTPLQVRGDPAVIAAYLGEGDEDEAA